jgi:thiamine pyrophosphate-dependent acetolactate synthase large subunit-like protein
MDSKEQHVHSTTITDIAQPGALSLTPANTTYEDVCTISSPDGLRECDVLYSSEIGDFRALLPFVSPCVACVLGGTVGQLARGLLRAGFRLSTARSEMGAGFYALGMCVGGSSPRPALVLTVGGGAAAALAQPLWCAYLRRAPIVALTGEVSSECAGRGAVQDGTGRDGPSITSMLQAVTCRSVAVWSPEEAWREILSCIELALAHRLPAHVSIPIDVQKKLLRGVS